jgi:hypothetical protein
MIIIDQMDCTNHFPFRIHTEQLCAYQGLGIGVCFVSLYIENILNSFLL